MGSSQNGLGRVWGAEACVALKEKSLFLSPDLTTAIFYCGVTEKATKVHRDSEASSRQPHG